MNLREKGPTTGAAARRPFARAFLACCILLTSLLATSVRAGVTSDQTSKPFDDAEDCVEAIPAEASVAGVVDDGHVVTIDVHVLLDGIPISRGTQVMEQVKKAYAPLKIDIRSTFQEVSFPAQRNELEFPTDQEKVPTSDSAYLFDQSKKTVGGARPGSADVVYLLTADNITGSVAGQADCIGGVRYPNRSFAIGEESADAPPSTLSFCCTWTTAKVAAHEIAHLMGAHHHYANCAEAAPTAVADRHMLTCTLMFNDVGAVNLHFSALEGAVVRGHALKFADRPTGAPKPQPSTEPSPQPQPSTEPSPQPQPSTEPSPQPQPSTEASPQPTPTSSPSGDVTYVRTISLELVRHLVVRGKVDDGDSDRCSGNVMVAIERRKGRQWIHVASTRSATDGSFRIRLQDRTGGYRAIVEQTTGSEPGPTYRCSAAASTSSKHRHH